MHELFGSDDIDRHERLGHGASFGTTPQHDQFLSKGLDLKDHGNLPGCSLSGDLLRLKARCEDNQRVRPGSQIAQRGHSAIVDWYFFRANRDHGRRQLGRSWVEYAHL